MDDFAADEAEEKGVLSKTNPWTYDDVCAFALAKRHVSYVGHGRMGCPCAEVVSCSRALGGEVTGVADLAYATNQ